MQNIRVGLERVSQGGCLGTGHIRRKIRKDVSLVFRNIKIAGLCLASMLVMSMALAGTASAAGLLWLVCLEGSGLTKYESSTCLKAASGGKWQSVGVTKEVTVKLLVISLLLADTKVPILGEVVANCPNEGSIGEGVIKANGEGEIRAAGYTAAAAKKCKDEKGNCPEFTEVRGVNLPWITNIIKGANGEPLTKIEPTAANREAKKEPGWEVKCNILGGISDVCTSPAKEEEQARLVNLKSTTELLVAALFEEKVKATCTQGGAKAGEVKGIIAILLPGGALSINPV